MRACTDASAGKLESQVVVIAEQVAMLQNSMHQIIAEVSGVAHAWRTLAFWMRQPVLQPALCSTCGLGQAWEVCEAVARNVCEVHT
jgi:hypothetical protein